MWLNWDELREWGLAVVAVVIFVRGLIEYRKAQKWKRAEWVASEMKDFFQDPYVRNALMILDWKDRRLPLLIQAPTNVKAVAFDYEEGMLHHALSSRSSPQTRDYSDSELSVRDSFDRLFDWFERIDAFIGAGLVSPDELKPYLRYWVAIIGNAADRKKSPEARARIWAYVDDYGFSGVQSLSRSFGFDISPHAESLPKPRQ